MVATLVAMLLLVPERKPALSQCARFLFGQALALVWVSRALPNSSTLGVAAALSVAYLAIENLLVKRAKPWRLRLIIFFGWLHGAALIAGGAVSSAASIAGATVGQLAVIGLVGMVIWILAKKKNFDRFRIFLSAVIAFLGGYWMVAALMS